MREFTWVSGQLTEVQRFINVPMRWCEQYPARERRELWITTAEGEDFKFVVHTRVMPARRGHRVVGVLSDGELVGLHNLSSGEGVNFVRTDPPLLWRRCDAVALVLLVMTSALAGCIDWYIVSSLALLATLLYAPVVILGRWWKRRTLVRSIGYAINSAKRQAAGQSRLTRVK